MISSHPNAPSHAPVQDNVRQRRRRTAVMGALLAIALLVAAGCTQPATYGVGLDSDSRECVYEEDVDPMTFTHETGLWGEVTVPHPDLPGVNITLDFDAFDNHNGEQSRIEATIGGRVYFHTSFARPDLDKGSLTVIEDSGDEGSAYAIFNLIPVDDPLDALEDVAFTFLYGDHRLNRLTDNLGQVPCQTPFKYGLGIAPGDFGLQIGERQCVESEESLLDGGAEFGISGAIDFSRFGRTYVENLGNTTGLPVDFWVEYPGLPFYRLYNRYGDHNFHVIYDGADPVGLRVQMNLVKDPPFGNTTYHANSQFVILTSENRPYDPSLPVWTPC